MFDLFFRQPRLLALALAALPEVAGAVLDEAPRREGIRVTAWWRHTSSRVRTARLSRFSANSNSTLKAFFTTSFQFGKRRENDGK